MQDHITQSTDPVLTQQIQAEKPSLGSKTSLWGKTASGKTIQYILEVYKFINTNIQRTQKSEDHQKRSMIRISSKYREMNNIRGNILNNKKYTNRSLPNNRSETF